MYSTTENIDQQENFSTIIRKVHNRENPYAQLNRKAIWDKDLSLKAVGLWARCMSRKDGWHFSVKELVKSCKEGRKAIDSAMRELIDNDYVIRLEFNTKDEHGKFLNNVYDENGKLVQRNGGIEYVIFEFRATEEEKQEELDKFKKSFRHCPFGNPHLSNCRKVQLIKKDRGIKKDKTNTYAPSKDDAQATPLSSLSDSKRKKPPSYPKKPWRTICRYERVPNHSSQADFLKHFKIPLVCTSNEEHDKLVKKHGEEKVTQAYEILADWKLSKAETEPSVLDKHIDYHRITKWVMKQVLESPLGAARGYKRKGKLVLSMDDRAREEKCEYISAEITGEEKIKIINEAFEKMKRKTQEARDEKLKEKSYT